MIEQVFPEIQAAAEALESRIALTEAEVAEMKDGIKTRRSQLRAWRKALAAFDPKRTGVKKRASGRQPSAKS